MDGRRRVIRDAARDLRQRATPSEQALWEVVRDGRFRGLKFRRQHPIGPFVLDFYCRTLRVAIEIDGGVHQLAEQRRHDAARQSAVEREGIRIVRIDAADVERDPRAALERALLPFPLSRRATLTGELA
jgi:very-short-patch-repair endonuclease